MFPARVLPIVVASGVLLMASALGAGTIAFAHNQVAQTVPAADDTVQTSPLTVSVTTVEPLLQTDGSLSGFAMTLTDNDGGFYGDGCLRLSENTLSADFELGESGVYELTYQFISADGHTVSDRFRFTFEAPENHRAAPALPRAPQCGETTVEEELPSEPAVTEPLNDVSSVSSDLPEASPAEVTPGPTWLTATAGAVTAVLALGALWWVSHRRKSRV